MVYYASNNGVNDGLSAEHPGNILDLIKILKSGDTLYLLSGVYNFNEQVTLELTGDVDNEVLISAYDFENLPIFDFRMQPYGKQFDKNCNGVRVIGEYIHINGLIIAYSGFKGLRIDTSNSIYENIEVYGSCDSGIHICSGSNNTLISCKSHDNFGYKTTDRCVSKFGANSDGISDKLHYGKPNTFINCESYNNTDDGFDFFGRCTEEFTVLNSCKSYNNGIKTFDMTNYPRYEIDKEWFDEFKNGKLIKTPKGDKVTVTLENYPAFGNGNGFKLGGKRRYHCVELNECEAKNNNKGFDQNHNSGIMKLNNCVAEYNLTYDYAFCDADQGEIYFTNCTSETNKNSIKVKNAHVNNNNQ